MPRRRKRDLTLRQQLAGGPVDLPFLMLVLLLTAMGLIAVFSASYASSYYESGKPTTYFMSQLRLGAGGLIILWAASHIDYHWWQRRGAKWCMWLALVLLVLVKVPGIGVTRNGANRWVRLLGVQFQPSEVAKLAVILVFAAMLARRRPEKRRKWNAKMTLGRILNFTERIGLNELVPYAGILLLVLFLLYLEPHMSGMILISIAGAAVLWAGGIHWGWFVAGGGLLGGGLWYIMNSTEYMAKRLATQSNPWLDMQGSGYQVVQSLYAIGSGGLLGKGLGQSVQKYLYLPEEHNDYIFSIWCEEMGFIGAFVVILLFALLIVRGYWLALHARDKFGALVIVGITTLTAVQVFLNIAVVTNLIPPTGISLPFFSFGGTALMIQLGEMGIVLSVSRQIEAPREG